MDRAVGSLRSHLAVIVMPIVMAMLLGSMASAVAAAERVRAEIDLSEQRLSLFVDGNHYDTWLVSTARPGYRTPVGTYRPIRLERKWFSRKYDWAPMPYSIFFLGGYAIHGTTEVKRLGRPVSHGCIRLDPSNAARLFDLVKQVGKANTTIVIHQ